MANPEHVEIVKQGADAIAGWRAAHTRTKLDLSEAILSVADLIGADLSRADLSRANLSGANLSGADLLGANLFGADLSGAYLSRAYLLGADLSGANLFGAHLLGAHLLGADLRGADLRGADLLGAYLLDANLAEADFGKAVLAFTGFGNIDFSAAQGVASVVHEGPSTIGADTLIRSFRGAGNKLTPALATFFRGAGVPQELLDALPAIIAEVEYYSAFISYGQPDADMARRLYEDLKTRGVACWLYEFDATLGKSTWQEIGQKRREADRMVVLCSFEALVRDGVKKEIEEQIDEDQDKLIPVSLDNQWMANGFDVRRGDRDLKPFLLNRNYADFTDPRRYDPELKKLLKALRRKES